MNQSFLESEKPKKKEKPINFKEPRIMVIVMLVLTIAVIAFYCVASMITSVGYQTFLENELPATMVSAKGNKARITVILDAGHGGEDPGAMCGGIKEKDLNLTIAKKMSEILSASGIRVIMTRTTDRMLYNSGEEKQKKFYDLYNRLQIAKSYENSLFVSIHMNSYPLGNCSGLQTFYSEKNEQGRVLAEKLHESARLLLPDNKRLAKPDDEIYLLKNNASTAVLIECGFLSNEEELHNLCDESYQDRLVFTLCVGITDYLEDLENENELHLQSMRQYNGEMVREMS